LPSVSTIIRGARSRRRVDVLVPEVHRLEDVAVGVDDVVCAVMEGLLSESRETLAARAAVRTSLTEVAGNVRCPSTDEVDDVEHHPRLLSVDVEPDGSS